MWRNSLNNAFDAYCGAKCSEDVEEDLPPFNLIIRNWIFPSADTKIPKAFLLQPQNQSNLTENTCGEKQTISFSKEELDFADVEYADCSQRFDVVGLFILEKLSSNSTTLSPVFEKQRRKWASVICDGLEELYGAAVRLLRIPNTHLVCSVKTTDQTVAMDEAVGECAEDNNLYRITCLISEIAPPKDIYVSLMSVIALSSTFGEKNKKKSSSDGLYLALLFCLLQPLGTCLRRIQTKRAAFLASSLSACLHKAYECNHYCIAEGNYLIDLSNNLLATAENPSPYYWAIAAAVLRHLLALVQALGPASCKAQQDDDFHRVGNDSCVSFIEMAVCKHVPFIVEVTDDDGHPSGFTLLPQLPNHSLESGIPRYSEDSFVKCVYSGQLPTWTESEAVLKEVMGSLLQLYASCFIGDIVCHLETYVNDPLADGHGALETTPLIRALLAYVFFVYIGVGEQSISFPLVSSPLRLMSIMLNSSRVLLDNAVNASNNNFFKTSYAEKGHYLFLTACSLAKVVAQQTPAAFETIHGLISVEPSKYINSLLQSLAVTPGLSKRRRLLLFDNMRQLTRRYSWQKEFEIYMLVLSLTNYDAVCGAVGIIIKDRWWEQVNAWIDAKDERKVAEEAQRLTRFLRTAIDYNVKVLDSTDLITTALNLVKLVLLSPKISSSANVLPYLMGRRTAEENSDTCPSKPHFDLKKKLDNLAAQLDMELRMETIKTSSTSHDTQQNFCANASQQRLSLVSFLLSEIRLCLSKISNQATQISFKK